MPLLRCFPFFSLFLFSPWPGPMCCDEPTLPSGVALTVPTSSGLFFLYSLKRGKQLLCISGPSSIQPDKNLQKCNSVQWHSTPILLPGKSQGRRSRVGCSPWGRWELDTTQWLHFHFSLSCIGEGNGNPLQYSCLENPRDGGASWAAAYGVAQSQTQLKRLGSSSSSSSSSTLCVLIFHLQLC